MTDGRMKRGEEVKATVTQWTMAVKLRMISMTFACDCEEETWFALACSWIHVPQVSFEWRRGEEERRGEVRWEWTSATSVCERQRCGCTCSDGKKQKTWFRMKLNLYIRLNLNVLTGITFNSKIATSDEHVLFLLVFSKSHRWNCSVQL